MRYGQRGTMKGCLIWRRNAWYGKWLVGHKQILRRFGTNYAEAKKRLKREVAYVNRQANEIKDEALMKRINRVLNKESN